MSGKWRCVYPGCSQTEFTAHTQDEARQECGVCLMLWMILECWCSKWLSRDSEKKRYLIRIRIPCPFSLCPLLSPAGRERPAVQGVWGAEEGGHAALPDDAERHRGADGAAQLPQHQAEAGEHGFGWEAEKAHRAVWAQRRGTSATPAASKTAQSQCVSLLCSLWLGLHVEFNSKQKFKYA